MHPVISLWGLPIMSYSLFLLAACAAVLFFYLLSPVYSCFYSDDIINMLPLLAFFALIGGKLLYALSAEAEGQSFLQRFIFGGSVFYGCAAGFTLGLFIGGRRKSLDFIELLDLFMSLLPLGQAIGRLGCYFNGCCYGKIYGGFLSVPYIIEGEAVRVFPCWFFESGFCLLLFLALRYLLRSRPAGRVSGIYIVSYSVFRFFIEFLRGDGVRGLFGALSSSQLISLIILPAGVWLLFSSSGRRSNKLFISGRKENEY